MHEKKRAERHDAGYLVQFTKQKRSADFDCHFLASNNFGF
jgi:hypothetical protein